MGILSGTIIDAELDMPQTARGAPTPLAERDRQLREAIDLMADHIDAIDVRVEEVKQAKRAGKVPSDELLREIEAYRARALDAARLVVEARKEDVPVRAAR